MVARNRHRAVHERPDDFDGDVARHCDTLGIGHVIEASVYTAVERLHAAFPWLGASALAWLTAHQTGRYLFVCQSAVSRLANEGRLKE